MLSIAPLVNLHYDGPSLVHARTGDMVLVTGASGCGKSTLVRALAGLWPWCQGSCNLPAHHQVQLFRHAVSVRMIVSGPASTHALPFMPANVPSKHRMACKVRCQIDFLEPVRWLHMHKPLALPSLLQLQVMFVPQRPVAAPGKTLLEQLVYPSLMPEDPANQASMNLQHLEQLLQHVGLLDLLQRAQGDWLLSQDWQGTHLLGFCYAIGHDMDWHRTHGLCSSRCAAICGTA